MKGVEVEGIMHEAESDIQDQVVGFYRIYIKSLNLGGSLLMG